MTLGIAISSTVFTQLYGKRIVREHFGTMGGRNLELSGRQAFYVTVFVLSLSAYMVWLMN